MTLTCHRNHLSPRLVLIQRIPLVTKTSTNCVYLEMRRQTHRNINWNSTISKHFNLPRRCTLQAKTTEQSVFELYLKSLKHRYPSSPLHHPGHSWHQKCPRVLLSYFLFNWPHLPSVCLAWWRTWSCQSLHSNPTSPSIHWGWQGWGCCVWSEEISWAEEAPSITSPELTWGKIITILLASARGRNPVLWM